MAALHSQLRIVRLAMVLVIAALTVFLYASYYSSPMLTMPSRMHLIATASDYDGETGNAANALLPEDQQSRSSSSSSSRDQQQKSPPQSTSDARTPVVLSDTEDVNGSYAQQYLDVSIPSSPAYTNTSSNVAAKSTVVTQKGAANATATTSGAAAAAVSQPASAVPASVPATAQKPSTRKPTAPAASASGNVDTLKGVRTSALYEPGHSETSADLCPNSGEFLRLLILITSAPKHHDARLAIRQTWGSFATRRDISIGFILGSTQNAALDDTLAAENFMYGDLIRGHFLDSYNNLTLKTISSLEWVDRYCPKVTFVLKTDDDMFINIPRLLAFTDKHTKDTNVIYGRLAKNWKPIRNTKSKYYVSPQQYFPAVFPYFTTGPAYLMTSDVVHGLYAKALNQTYLKLEDVFTTGIVAQLVNVKRVHVNEFMNRRIAFNPCNLRRVISVHMVKSNEQFDLWKKLLDTATKCK